MTDDLLTLMKSRRSCRHFLDKAVPCKLLETLIEAGRFAPSASNVQAWKFCLITDPDLVRKVDLFSPGLSGKPPVILAICSDREYAGKRGGVAASEILATIDASMAAENIMLEAVSLGLGTCAIKSFNNAAVRKLLKLPPQIEIELLLSIGYPDADPHIPLRKPLEEILFYNKWKETCINE